MERWVYTSANYRTICSKLQKEVKSFRERLENERQNTDEKAKLL